MVSDIMDIFEAGYDAGEQGPLPSDMPLQQVESLMMALALRAASPLRAAQLIDATRLSARLLGWKVTSKANPEYAQIRLRNAGKLQLMPDYTIRLGPKAEPQPALKESIWGCTEEPGLKGVDSGP